MIRRPITTSREQTGFQVILGVTLFVLGGVLIYAASRQHPPLLQLRRDYHLNWEEPLENSPPLVSFTTVALGGFRGIIADLLWLRASKLQDEKKYFELVQLADWITKLEPRFALVWAFHGWNMSYNISVLFDDPADRWRWVKHGIGLMRDQGLTYNPGDPRLHRELGWLFQHKVGGLSDQAHMYYKRQWGQEMMALFDGPHPDYETLLANPQDPRGVRLRQVYKLDPALMQDIDQRYGPLDWRLPQAHAIYWAYRGRPYASGFERVALDRMIFQGMQDAFWQGHAVVVPDEDVFIPVPKLDLLPRVRRAYEEAVVEHPDQVTIRSAHRNFLRAAIVLLYENNRLRTARAVFTDLHERYPSAVGDRTFERFVREEFTNKIEALDQTQALALVMNTLVQSYQWLALNETDRATGIGMLARLFYQQYQASRRGSEHMARTGLPPYQQLQTEAREQVRARLKSAAARTRLDQPTKEPAEEAPNR